MMQTVEEKLVVKERKFDEKNVGIVKGVDEWEFLNIQAHMPWKEEKDFSHISFNLLRQFGYFHPDDSLKDGCIVDLLTQAREIVTNANKYMGSIDPYITAFVHLPDDKTGEIMISQSIDGKTIIKLTSDA